jgi:hypothetical protein
MPTNKVKATTPKITGSLRNNQHTESVLLALFSEDFPKKKPLANKKQHGAHDV